MDDLGDHVRQFLNETAYQLCDGFAVNVTGNQFIIHGNKIKLAGDHPDVGLYFVPVEQPEGAVKVTRITENSPSKIIGIAPGTWFSVNRLEVRTQWAGSGGVLLKAPPHYNQQVHHRRSLTQVLI